MLSFVIPDTLSSKFKFDNFSYKVLGYILHYEAFEISENIEEQSIGPNIGNPMHSKYQIHFVPTTLPLISCETHHPSIYFKIPLNDTY